MILNHINTTYNVVARSRKSAVFWESAFLILPSSSWARVRDEMSLEFIVPCGHTVNLKLVVSLSRAFCDVSHSPFRETRCDLLNASTWISGVVTKVIHHLRKIIFNISSLSFYWATMKYWLVVKSTFEVSSNKVSFHTGCVPCKLTYPCVLWWEEGERVVHQLVWELGQRFETLKRVSWWHFLLTIVLCKYNSGQTYCRKLHIFKKGVFDFKPYRINDYISSLRLLLWSITIATGSPWWAGKKNLIKS